jgi:hypothetical protein
MIYLTFFLVLSIPIILFGLAQDDFDTRRKAFDDLQLSEENPCLISLPNVNPYSLEVDKTVTVQVDADLQDIGIEQLQIFNSVGEEIYQESFKGSPIEIATSFPFTPGVSGKATLSGILTKVQGGSVACQISSPYDIKGLEVVPENRAPEFTSRPSESKPSQNIKTEVMYEYTLVATDEDGDRINYAYSFTPRADWLKPTVIEDGSGGKLTIKFSGKTNKPASYLANIFIHDGYSQNLRSQSWIINVSPSENDIPVVTIIDPASSLRINKGTTFKTIWEASDLNHIINYDLFITNNPANEDAWISVDKDIPYDTTSYNVDTSTLDSGTYKVIVQATDNQQPPGIGKGVSPEIVVSTATEPEPETDDRVVISQPQVTNMSPTSTEEITNRMVSVRATIIASTDAQIDEDSISFSLDNRDISDRIKINKISQQEYNLIYQPEVDLDTGLHKAEISFSDTEGLEADKSWNFTIQGEEEGTEDIYNIFGYEIAKNIVHIIGIGVLTVILALVTPFIIFSIWKDDKEEPVKNTKLPPTTPTDSTKYIEEEVSEIEDKVQTVPEENNEDEAPQEEDIWDKYSAPKPTQVQESQEEVQDEKESSEQEQPSTQTIEEQPQPKQEQDTPDIQPSTEDINVEETPQKEQPQVQSPPPVEQPESTPESKPEPTPETKPEVKVEIDQQPEEKEPERQEAPIPEPEIPEITELENLSKQLQKIKEEEQQEEQPSENTQ